MWAVPCTWAIGLVELDLTRGGAHIVEQGLGVPPVAKSYLVVGVCGRVFFKAPFWGGYLPDIQEKPECFVLPGGS